MSTDDLMDRYTGIGFPEENTMSVLELKRCLQKLATWQAMTAAMLCLECSLHDLPVVDTTKSEDEQRNLMVDMLLKNERMVAWEARGSA